MRKILFSLGLTILFLLVPNLVGAQAPTWYPDDGSVVLTYRAASGGNGLTTLCFDELKGSSLNYVGFFITCIYDAGGAGAIPQGEIREITSFNATTGVVTIGVSFAQAATGDRFCIERGVALRVLYGSQGVPLAITATKLATGVSMAEGMLYLTNSADSSLAYIHSASGAPDATGLFHAAGTSGLERLDWVQDSLRATWSSVALTKTAADSILGVFYGAVGLTTDPTGLFHGNGVNAIERLNFVQDSLRAVWSSVALTKTAADSILGVLYGAVGLTTDPTGLFHAGGVNTVERLNWLQDSLRAVWSSVALTKIAADSLVGKSYGNVGSQWSNAAASYAAGVSHEQVFASIQDLLDSIAVYDYGAGGIASFPAAEAPADGVPLAGAIRYGTDACDSLEGAFYGAVGVIWGTATEPANGVSFVEGVGYAQNQLDSLVGATYGAVGVQWGTAAEPAAGTSIEQAIHFSQNQLDSLVGATYGAVGVQWGTAAEPAAGTSIEQAIHYGQNQLDTLEGKVYGNVGSQWANAAATYAAGVSHEQVLMSVQDLLDSSAVYLFAAGGIATFPASEAPADGVPLAAVVRSNYDLGVGLRDSVEVANNLLQKFNGVTTGYVDENIWTTVNVVVNFAAAGAWEDAASTHEVFTVTGSVEFEISAFCSTDVGTTSSDSLWMFLGESGATGARAISLLGDDADNGENFIPAEWSPGYIWTAAGLTTNAGGKWKGTIHMGKDIGYDIDDHDFTGGIIVFYCRWRPITTGSAVVAAAGGSL